MKLIFLLIAIFSLSANAQTSFSGKITDAKTGEALFAATIVLLKNDKIITGAESDFDGNFSITGLDADTCDVRCTYQSMNDYLLKDFVIQKNKANKLDIHLESAPALEVVNIRIVCGHAAQTSLTGKVTDAKTGEALFAANIVVLQNGSIVTGAESDFDGNYSINGLREGVYEVRCNYTGMEDVFIKNFPIKIDKANQLDIAMESAELGRVIIIRYGGRYNPIFNLDTPISGQIWNAREISSSPIK